MSATNTPLPAGQAPGAPRPMPRRATANPLVSRKQQRRPPAQALRPTTQRPSHGIFPTDGISGGQMPLQANLASPRPGQMQQPQQQPPEEFVDIPVYTTKRQLLEGYRHHVMRFLPNGSSKSRNVNIADESQFSRPVKLHRRDPRATNQNRWREDGDISEEPETKTMDAQERERLEAQRAERRAEREANQAQMAPVAKAAAAQKTNKMPFAKKTEQVFQVNSEKAHKVKDFQLRYEEAKPWHVEDFDGKNIWSGTYEGALSDCHVMMVEMSDGQGGTRLDMIPLEKWYKFNAKNQFKALTIEEAEARMKKRVKDPRWFMETQKATEQASKERTFQRGGKLYTRAGERGEKAIKGEDGEGPEIANDIDDIDYNYEEAFADDEENALFEGGEDESKEAEEKIKREQREANIFELKEQKDFDKEEEEAKAKAREEKKKEKRMRKQLMNKEKNYVYEDDSDENPYSSESDSEDSEIERQKEEDKKKEEEREKQAAEKGKGPASASTIATAPTSTPGTPSKPTKTTDPLRKGILKRPGSPNLSEASGSESSRVKKPKKKHPSSGDTSSTPTSTTSHLTSPTNMAGSDAEMSDGSTLQAKKLKIRLTSTNNNSDNNDSPRRPPSPPIALPTPEEIKALIPLQGMHLSDVIKKFKNEKILRNAAFLPLMKEHSRWDKNTKMFYPKGE